MLAKTSETELNQYDWFGAGSLLGPCWVPAGLDSWFLPGYRLFQDVFSYWSSGVLVNVLGL